MPCWPTPAMAIGNETAGVGTPCASQRETRLISTSTARLGASITPEAHTSEGTKVGFWILGLTQSLPKRSMRLIKDLGICPACDIINRIAHYQLIICK